MWRRLTELTNLPGISSRLQCGELCSQLRPAPLRRCVLCIPLLPLPPALCALVLCRLLTLSCSSLRRTRLGLCVLLGRDKQTRLTHGGALIKHGDSGMLVLAARLQCTVLQSVALRFDGLHHT